MNQENLNINQKRWENFLIRYDFKEFIIDDFDNKYVIMHNYNKLSFKKSILKFKYSKISLNGLIDKMKSNKAVSKLFIDEVERYYKDKKDVSIIPLNLNQIRDNLFDINLLIKYCVENKIDWEFIPKKEYEKLNPTKKKKLKRKRKTNNRLLEMSLASLKIETSLQEKEMSNLLEKIEKSIVKLKKQINVRTKQ